MSDLLNNKLVWLAGLLVLFNVMFFFGSKLIVDKAVDKVMDKLERYSPSPYGPSYDPDKMTPETLKRRALLQTYLEQKAGGRAILLDSEGNPKLQKVKFTDDWRNDWEKQRGFSPE